MYHLAMTLGSETRRWIHRFDNFKRAYALLAEAIDLARQRELSQLEMEGVIKRFKYA
jgi:hypothetical protein